MKLKGAKVACVVPVFKKPARRVSGALRHVIFSRGLSGTKSLIFRAGRYSVHQFVRSFSALFAALIVIPNLLTNALLYLKPKQRQDGVSWASGITASIKSTFVGIPSVFRSAWAGVMAGFYGVGASCYHAIESAKSCIMGLKLMQAISHMNQAIWSFFVGLYQSVKIPVCHFCEYVGTVWEGFRTGTQARLEKLRAREHEWGHSFVRHLDNGRNYVHGALQQTFAAISGFFEKIWQAISGSFETVQTSFSSAGVKVKESSHVVWVKIQDSAGAVGHLFKSAPGAISSFFTKAPGVVKEKAQYVVVQIQDTATNAATKVKIAMADLMQMIKGAGEKIHEEEVHVKTVASNIRAKAHDFVDGIKVGTVEIVRKAGEKGKVIKEQAVLYFKAAHGKLSSGRLFIKRRVAMRIEQAASGAHHLRERIADRESSVRNFFVESARKVQAVLVGVTRPIAAPFVYVYQLPHRMYASLPSPTLSSYMAMLMTMLISYWFYLKIECRYKRETYARSLAPHSKVRNGCQEFHLSDAVLRQCMEKLRAQIDMGLNPATREKASVKCFNTYVQDLPTGREKGQFLALDLGGTNFRVLLITLNGRHFDMQSKIYVVPKDIMTGDGEQLFDHIASCLESFALQHRVANKNLPLGFTFSFPLMQVGLKSGILQRWTKGFNCANTVSKDVVQMLQEALQKKSSTKIDVVAILNDTTGTLMSCAWKNHNCKVGVILGTGSNACYVEKISNVIGFDGDETKPHVIINTEWGAFGDNGELDFIRTPYDKEIDKHSVNPGKQLFEKMVSGMYLGELARLLIVKFLKDKVLFGGQSYPRLQERWNFLTEYISEIESDPRGVFKQCRNVLGKLGVLDPTDQDCSNIRYICESVSRRAAYLASSGVATLINKMDIPSITVGVDGSLYRYHPHFHNLMHEKIPELCNQSIENLNINLMLSEDGSGRGAALIAASGSDLLHPE